MRVEKSECGKFRKETQQTVWKKAWFARKTVGKGALEIVSVSVLKVLPTFIISFFYVVLHHLISRLKMFKNYICFILFINCFLAFHALKYYAYLSCNAGCFSKSSIIGSYSFMLSACEIVVILFPASLDDAPQ